VDDASGGGEQDARKRLEREREIPRERERQKYRERERERDSCKERATGGYFTNGKCMWRAQKEREREREKRTVCVTEKDIER
jgi:hypothetical protein